ncbi:MbtH family protein [Nocardioides speluncae]|uniref:MbtH family protein n=1 Tax=Nocardioides speluncae TaxID=2670337 RepID=UPI000D694C16|nr:MbtH family NRPS accessory protein [Nocardioides speluncae]
MTDTKAWTYLVVVNDEEQYSIWREGFPLPEGWREAGFTGSEQACMDHIDTVWTDLRPRSLREAQDG